MLFIKLACDDFIIAIFMNKFLKIYSAIIFIQ